jgi:hypothetical protein
MIDVLVLSAANVGNRTVTIVSVELEFPDKSHLVFPWPFGDFGPLPREIKPGKGATALTPRGDVVHRLRLEGYSGKAHLRARFRDALSNEFLSRDLVVRIDELP